MVEVLKQLHVYEDLCDLNSNETEITNSIVNCNQRDVIFSTAGTIGGFSMNVMTLVFGLIVDKKGLFLSRSLITITVTVGLLCLMFTPDANWLMFPGIFLQSAGGYAFVLTNATMSTLFPKFAAIVLVLGQCLFQIASSYFRKGLQINELYVKKRVFEPRKEFCQLYSILASHTSGLLAQIFC